MLTIQLFTDFYKKKLIERFLGRTHSKAVGLDIIFNISYQEYIEIANSTELNENVEWEQTLKNLEYNLNARDLAQVLSIPRKNLNISSITNIEWSIELIKTYEQVWNWASLSSNMSIPFDAKLIEEFSSCWNWRNLSLNSSIPFSIELLKTFEDLWHWPTLSSNKNFRWTKEIISTFKDKIDWKVFSQNSNADWYYAVNTFRYRKRKEIDWVVLSNNPALKAETLLEIKATSHGPFLLQNKGNDDYPLFKFPHTYGEKKYTLTSVNLTTGRSYYEEDKGFKLNILPSISSNTGLIWTDELFSIYFKDLDFWTIALRGKLNNSLVIKYAAMFDENRYVYSTDRKHSDWGTFEVYHYYSGWHNLAINPNFHPDEDFLDWASKRMIRVIPEYDIGESPTQTKVLPSSILYDKGIWISIDSLFEYRSIILDYSNL